jgi:hypothetical protein
LRIQLRDIEIRPQLTYWATSQSKLLFFQVDNRLIRRIFVYLQRQLKRSPVVGFEEGGVAKLF